MGEGWSAFVDTQRRVVDKGGDATGRGQKDDGGGHEEGEHGVTGRDSCDVWEKKERSGPAVRATHLTRTKLVLSPSRKEGLVKNRMSRSLWHLT